MRYGGHFYGQIIKTFLEGGGTMKVLWISLGLSLILLGMGCSTAQIKSDFNREINFSNLKTFGWMEITDKPSDNPYMLDSLLEKNIRNATLMELKTKGYLKEEEKDPDFLVTYHVGISEKEVKILKHDNEDWRNNKTKPYALSYTTSKYPFRWKEGTLILFVIETTSKQLVWYGWYIDAFKNMKIGEEKINKAVRQILEEFPPQKL
jgi:hypothetical protein